MEHQAILFNRNSYTQPKAQQWLKSHGYKPLKYHITDNYIRARLKHPNYKNFIYRTSNIAKNIKSINMIPLRHRKRIGGSFPINKAIDLFANGILPLAFWGGITYGLYKAAKHD